MGSNLPDGERLRAADAVTQQTQHSLAKYLSLNRQRPPGNPLFF